MHDTSGKRYGMALMGGVFERELHFSFSRFPFLAAARYAWRNSASFGNDSMIQGNDMHLVLRST